LKRCFIPGHKFVYKAHAVIKPSAATPAFLKHRGPAVVFETVEELHEKVNDENLEIDETCIMILKGAGPKGYPGFAEVGNMSLPAKVLRKGITDMVRISDGRMSGTAYGTVVLHVAPEAAVGGPLAFVQTDDMIELDVPKRRLHLEVSDEELARRKQAWKVPVPPARGWHRLFHDHVLPADQGVDLDFLVGNHVEFSLTNECSGRYSAPRGLCSLVISRKWAPERFRGSPVTQRANQKQLVFPFRQTTSV
jgi:L-arabonate dehydrase